MEGSIRLFQTTNLHHRLHRSILPRHSLKFPPKLSPQILTTTSQNPNRLLFPFAFSPSHNRFQSSRIQPPSNPLRFLLSLSASHLTNSPLPNHHAISDPNERCFSWHKAPEIVNGGDLGLIGKRKPELTVVLLGWLGAKQKHLKRYADLYTSRGIHAVTFVVPVRDVLWFDLGRRVEKRISVLAEQLVSWLSEVDDDGRDRCLLFHTFSNTGWLAYGAILDYLQSRGDFMNKIRGCTIDSGGDPEINPQVWAAGFSAALLKKRSSATAPSVGVIDGKELEIGNGITVQDNNAPLLIETLLLSLLEKVFSVILKLPDVNRRLSKIISILTKNQPPCPQLYLYSTADKVIPFPSVEMFIEDQKMKGKKVWAFNFGSSHHVDHYRSYPHIYSVELHNFLKDCLTSDVQK